MSFGPHLVPTSIFGTLGFHFGTIGEHLGDPDLPRNTPKDTFGTRHRFLMDSVRLRARRMVGGATQLPVDPEFRPWQAAYNCRWLPELGFWSFSTGLHVLAGWLAAGWLLAGRLAAGWLLAGWLTPSRPSPLNIQATTGG